MRILISNDDGYKAAGIHVLARVMAKFGDVTVVAPKFHQSAMSIAVSLGVKQLAYKELPEEGPGNWSYLDATPASCIKFGLQYKYENRNPDLVVAGINHGSNASTGANYSATLGAVEEAAINGIRGIGVSITSHRADADLSAVEQMLPGIIRDLLAKWPENRPGLYFNINFPDAPLELIKGVKWARQGHGHWIKEFEEWDERRLVELGLTDVFLWQHYRVELEPGEKAYFMKGEFVNDDNDPALADHLLVKDGWVTITPCVADLTDYTVLNAACPGSPCK
ncbi:MAG: 5'/3'-nucleotidase SurE [Bacteroidales bacterium]|nr:5'/3'-nucleotidase SurE [Bacteroidales bacterium]